jgi:hypothetical protein
MDKILYLVCGPESSGNRLMARILMAAGCYGDGDVIQRLDKEDPPPDANRVVLHRSFPYGAQGGGRHWPNINKLNDRFSALGYGMFVVVMARDHHCMARSQVEKGKHVKTLAEAQANIISAYGLILSYVMNFHYVVVPYESIVLHPRETISWLLEYLALPPGEFQEEIRDENIKWYQSVV